jgi:hypothetical protein
MSHKRSDQEGFTNRESIIFESEEFEKIFLILNKVHVEEYYSYLYVINKNPKKNILLFS